MPATIRFNPYEKGFYSDPYAQYRKLREHEPVHKSFMGTWVLTRYEDIRPILLNPDFSSDPRHWRGYEQRYKNKKPVAWMLNRSVLNTDPPVHTCLRKTVVKAFAPDNLAALTQSIRETARKQLDSIDLSSGQFDVMSQFAVPVPVRVISDVYGVTPQDRTRIKQWSVDVSGLIEPLPSLHSLKEAEKSIHHFAEYLTDRIENESESKSFTGCLAAAFKNHDIQMDEVLANMILMFPAGHETTINLIGNGIYSLLRNPQQLELLRDNPDLLDGAIEEMLRYESPQQVAWRSVLANHEIDGRHIEKGDQVMMILGSANRDPQVFEDPERFDITRRPNPHLAFGVGRHTCLGSWFAKLQAKTAIALFLERFPGLSLPDQAPEWQSTLSFHGLKTFPVQVM